MSVQHIHQGLVTFLIVILYVSFINLMCHIFYLSCGYRVHGEVCSVDNLC